MIPYVESFDSVMVGGVLVQVNVTKAPGWLIPDAMLLAVWVKNSTDGKAVVVLGV